MLLTNALQAIADAATNKLDTFNLSVLSDGGFTGAEGDIGFIPAFVQNCYKVNIAVDPLVVLTDTPTTTACRSPVSIQVSGTSSIINIFLMLYSKNNSQICVF